MSQENSESLPIAASAATACWATDHSPDRSRLVTLGDWKPMSKEQLFDDCSQLLVAVPINCRHGGKWYYEYSVVVVHCDEDYFDLSCNDEPWGWELSDADFFMVLRK